MDGRSEGRSEALLPASEDVVVARARADIHLDRLESNVRNILAHIGPKVLLMAVVKADGYGHGAAAVGRAALEAGAHQLAVYTPNEAVYLRRAGIDGSIVVLGPVLPDQAETRVRHRMTPCVSSLQLARALSTAARSHSVTVPFHVEIDTGLTRYGIRPEDALPLLRALDGLPGLAREGLFTHFASADEDSKDLTRAQLSVFMDLRRDLERNGIRFPLYHAANSAAMLDLPETHLDMVRCGIALYGCYPSTSVKRAVARSR